MVRKSRAEKSWVEQKEKNNKQVLQRPAISRNDKPLSSQTLERMVNSGSVVEAASQGNDGVGAESGTIIVRTYTPHLPKWAYALIGTTAAAIIYLSGAAAGYFPNPFTNTPQPKPASTAQAGRVSPTTDRLATIRLYQPELAGFIEQQPWFRDGTDQREQVMLYNLEQKVSSSHAGYLQDKFALDGSEKSIIVTYDNDLADLATQTLGYVKEFIPRSQAFFGIPISWSVIYVDLTRAGNKVSGAGAFGNVADVSIRERDFVDIKHVSGHDGAGHLVLDQDSKGSPIWYHESLAEIGYNASSGDDASIKRIFEVLKSRAERNDYLNKKPLAEFTLEDHFKQADHVFRGMYLLLWWREVAGHQNFQTFVKANYTIATVKELTNNDVRENMLKLTPEDRKSEVAAMYDSSVFRTQN